MMRAIGVVFLKEVLENLRDRRVVFSAFFFGVLLAPALFVLMTTLAANRAVRTQDQPLKLPVAGLEHAPNLIRFLKEQGVEVEAVRLTVDEAMQAVRSGDKAHVLLITADYGEQLRSGSPAPLDLIVDSSANAQRTADSDRARRLLEAYGSQLAALRLLVRGVSPHVVQPVAVRTLDVATPAGRAVLILGMMTYFCLMAMLTGGFYIAIDTTAGERERGSLEPLLALPVNRGDLIIGKMLATCAFMTVSLLLTLVAYGIALRFVSLEPLGMSANFGPEVAGRIFGVMLPFVPLGAGMMTLVASFTRSNREAQTWLSPLMIVPIAPIMYAFINSPKPDIGNMAVPSLSQHLLATSFMRGDPVSGVHVAISVATTLIIGLALMWLAVRLYRRETILG